MLKLVPVTQVMNTKPLQTQAIVAVVWSSGLLIELPRYCQVLH